MGSDEARQLDLREVVRVLKRRRWLLVFSTAGVLYISLASALIQSPVYEASARILFQRTVGETLFDASDDQLPDPNRVQQTELEVLRSQAVADLVREEIGSAPGIAGRPLPGTDVIEVRARGRDPERVATVANGYADAYVEFKRTQAVDGLLEAADQIQRKIGEIDRQAAGATGALRDTLALQRQAFRQKLDQVQVDAALESGGAVKVADATVPDDPVEPQPVRRAVVGGVFGLLIGVGLAFLYDHLDDTFTTKAQLELAAPGLPVLGLIPKRRRRRRAAGPSLVPFSDKASTGAESYRRLRTSLQFVGVDRPARIVQVTSPSAGEGKTTTVANLAVALAEAGEKVAIVAGGLRRPRLQQCFGLEGSVGLTSVVAGTASLDEALQPVDAHPLIRVVVGGPEPPNQWGILGTTQMGDVLRDLAALDCIVLVDSPPVLPVTDALVLSQWVDAVLVVVAARSTTRAQLARAIELLGQVDAPVVGVVLNRAKAEQDGDDADYYYAVAAEQARRVKRPSRKKRHAASARTTNRPPAAPSDYAHDASPGRRERSRRT